LENNMFVGFGAKKARATSEATFKNCLSIETGSTKQSTKRVRYAPQCFGRRKRSNFLICRLCTNQHPSWTQTSDTTPQFFTGIPIPIDVEELKKTIAALESMIAEGNNRE
jgi:hypothetical protein